MISRRNYLAIVMLIITIFIMFMFVGKSNYFVNNNFLKIRAKDNLNFNVKQLLTADKLNMDNTHFHKTDNLLYGKKTAAVISQDMNDILTGLITEWCAYNKYFYRIYTSLPAKEELADYNLIIFGNVNLSVADNNLLYGYADLGKTMIFTKLPDKDTIGSDKSFSRIFGIDEVAENEVKADGIKIFSDFLISGERIYQKGDYFGSEDDTAFTVPYYKLSPGYEVYAVALFDDYENKGIEHLDLPPLLWRTKTGNSYVYVVGSDIFDGMSLLGIMTGFMSHGNDIYLYPVVNAQTISLVDFPYFSDENDDAMQRLYSRGSKNLARDILWPNIVQILKNYGGSYNFFAALRFDYTGNARPDAEYLKFYLNEIKKIGGNLGLSLSQVSDSDINDVLNLNNLYYGENIPDHKFSSLYLGPFEEGAYLGNADHELLENVSLVMSDYRDGDRLLDLINDNVISAKFNLYGYRHETMDDIRMICIENALGMCNMKVDISRVIYPSDNFDEWHNLSLIWSRGDTYFNEFSVFDTVSVSELENRVRRFLALDYTYEYDNNDIHISINNFDKEAYFILSTYDKSIKSINNGKFIEIKKDKYLVKASDADVYISLKDENVLYEPKNNRLISHNPYTKEEQP